MAENKRSSKPLSTFSANFSGDCAAIKDQEQYHTGDVPFFELCVCVCLNVCTLSAEAPVSKGHLISQAPRRAQLVFIKCRYLACTENERRIMLPARSPNH